jgi:hypothetical protein
VGNKWDEKEPIKEKTRWKKWKRGEWKGGVCFTDRPRTPLELKAKLLCEGIRPDEKAAGLFRLQNPSNVKRGGLSSGGKMRLESGLVVNAPFYNERKTDLEAQADEGRERGIMISMDGIALAKAEVLQAPAWYSEKVGGFAITQVLTAHNRQLATAVYEDCALFGMGKQCGFCVINQSLKDKAPGLVNKSGSLIVSALGSIPVAQYGGLTINGGMTARPGRGLEKIVPVVRAVSAAYPGLQIAVEITPPADLDWINRLSDAGGASLMMNLEMWEDRMRERLIPGKNALCPKESYLAAFERALAVLGPGKVTTCFVVGTEPYASLRKGISEVVSRGVIPSPLAGRYFEDVPNYPFAPSVDWREFLAIIRFARDEAARQGIRAMDKAGCVACGMCDLIKDVAG